MPATGLFVNSARRGRTAVVEHVEVRRVLRKAPRGLVDHMVVLFAERLVRSRPPRLPRRSVLEHWTEYAPAN